MYTLAIIVFIISCIAVMFSLAILLTAIVHPDFSIRETILSVFILLVCLCGCTASYIWVTNEFYRTHPYAVIKTHEVVTPKRMIHTKDGISDTTYVYILPTKDVENATTNECFLETEKENAPE